MSYQITIEPLGQTVEAAKARPSSMHACAPASGCLMPAATGSAERARCRWSTASYEVGDASPFALMDFERDERKAWPAARCRSPTWCSRPMSTRSPMPLRADARFQAGSVEILDVTPTIRVISLRPATIDFQAGQYVQVHIPGWRRARAFRSRMPRGRRCRAQRPARSQGAGTGWMHDKLQVGDPIPSPARWGVSSSAQVRHPAADLHGGRLGPVQSAVDDSRTAGRWLRGRSR